VEATVRKQVGNQVWIEVKASSVCEAVDGMAEYEEVFGQKECGMCKSNVIVCNHRVTENGDDYREWKCTACGAALPLHQYKKPREGCLYIVRWRKKEDGGGKLPDNGWSRWTPKGQDGQQPPPRQQGPAPHESEAPIDGSPF
jgi:hypothetical protein